MATSTRVVLGFGFLLVAAVAWPADGPAGARGSRRPLPLPVVGDSFAAPYDAVWDATLRNLGVLKTPVADKGAGRIETEPYPFAFVVGAAPARPRGPILLAARDPHGMVLAQSGSGDNKPTQVVWIAMHITLTRGGPNLTHVRVEPWVHDSMLPDFMPGPYNSPWGDLFAKIRSSLGGR